LLPTTIADRKANLPRAVDRPHQLPDGRQTGTYPLQDYPTSQLLVTSLFTQLAGGDFDVAVWRLLACGRTHFEPRPVGLQACSVSRSRSHRATGRCYSDPHTAESGVLHLPVTVASPAECIRFQRLMPAFQLSDLRIARRGPDVCHARDANELLEIAGNELRTIVRDNARLRLWLLFLGAFPSCNPLINLHLSLLLTKQLLCI
jgi:hypothetical protein